MKDAALILGFFAVGGAAVWFISSYKPFAGPGPAPAASSSVTPPADTKKAPPAKSRGKALSPAAEQFIDGPDAAPALTAAARMSPAAVPQAAPRVVRGNPEAVPVGTSVEQLDEMLGPPDLQTTTVNRGSLQQVYVYRRKPGQPTYLHLLDGRVVGKTPLR